VISFSKDTVGVVREQIRAINWSRVSEAVLSPKLSSFLEQSSDPQTVFQPS
jgi:hypothetical protein